MSGWNISHGGPLNYTTCFFPVELQLQAKNKIILFFKAEADMLFYAGMMELADLLSDSEAKPEVTVLEYDIIMPYLNNPKWQGEWL